MYSEIITTDNGAKLVANQRSAGCMKNMILSFIIIGVLALIFLVPDTSPIKSIIGTPIIIFGIIFALVGLSFIKKHQNKILITIENGYIKNEKQTVKLDDIINIEYGFHKERLSGGVFEDLIVTTKNNEKYYFSYYNLVSEKVIKKFIADYIIPSVSPDCKKN